MKIAIGINSIHTPASSLTRLHSVCQGYWKLDETSGNALDASGNGFTLTDVATVGTAAGQVGTSRDFEDTNSEKFTRTHEAKLNPAGSFTVAGMWKQESAGIWKPLASVFEITGDNRAWFVGSTGTSDELSIYCSSNGTTTSNSLVTGLDAQVGNWLFIVAQHRNGVDIRIQFTVMSAATRSATWSTPTAFTGSVFTGGSALFQIGGAEINGAQRYFDGTIDEVGFYNEIVPEGTLDDLFLHYKNGNSLF